MTSAALDDCPARRRLSLLSAATSRHAVLYHASRIDSRSVIMSVKQRLVTAEELLAMPEPPGMSLELVDGELVEVSPASFQHGLIATMLAGRLGDFARQQNLGFAMGDNVGYVLRRNPDHVRAPDVSFIAREQAPRGDDVGRFVQGAPTLAVEIVSPNDRASEVRNKVQDYLDAGTQQVWVLWPTSRSASVYRPDSDTRELGPDATLDGGDILPGFSVRVSDLFELR
jgi:Uma2 family endonuclease